MTQTLRLGRIAGIPIGVNWSVLVIMALLVEGLAVNVLPQAAPGHSWGAYLGLAVAGAVLFLLSLLAHEGAHAVVARHYGIVVERLTLWLLGGVAELRDEPPHARADFFVAVAGPATSVGTAGVFGVVAWVSSLVQAATVVVATFAWLAVINVVLAVFNLLPGAPLDGGRVLRAVLWWISGDRDKGNLTATAAGRVLGLLFVFAGIFEVFYTGRFAGLWLVLVGWFMLSAASVERAGSRMHSLLGDATVASVMNRAVVTGQADQSVSDFIESVVHQQPHRVFPVVDTFGHPVGVMELTGLAPVAPHQRPWTTLREVARPMDRVPTVEASRLLSEVTPMLSHGRMSLIVDNGVLVGILTPADVQRAIDLAALDRAAAPRGAGRGAPQ